MTADELIAEILQDPDCFPMSSEPETSDFIAALARMHGVNTALELGTWVGLTTLKLAKVSTSVITVDHEDYTKGRLEKLEPNNITQLKQDTLKPVMVPLDLVYFDSCHNGDHVLKEVESHWRFIKPGGLLLFHDTVSHIGPMSAALEMQRRGLISQVPLRTIPSPVTGALNGITVAIKL